MRRFFHHAKVLDDTDEKGARFLACTPLLHLRKSEMLHFQLVARKVLSCTNNNHESEGKRDKVKRQTVG
jgi:hypothetical protein